LFRINTNRLLKLGCGVFAAATLTAAPAAAQTTPSGPYASFGAGYQHRLRAAEDSVTYTDWDNGVAWNLAGGYKFGAVALEGEFSYFKNNDKTTASAVTGPADGVGNVTLHAFMANVRFESPNPGPVGLYVGGGLGGYRSYLNGISNVIAQQFGFVANGADEGVVFAWQLRAGAGLRLGEHAELLAGYRYFHGGDLTFLGTAFGDLHPNGAKIHSVEANLNVGF